MQCKVINSVKQSLEEDVNNWLKEVNPEIFNILQSESDSNGYITLTIFYFDKKEVRLKKLDKLNLKTEK
jgi:hypothetical protein